MMTQRKLNALKRMWVGKGYRYAVVTNQSPNSSRKNYSLSKTKSYAKWVLANEKSNIKFEGGAWLRPRMIALKAMRRQR